MKNKKQQINTETEYDDFFPHNPTFKKLIIIISVLAALLIIALASGCMSPEKLSNKRFNQAMQASKPTTAGNCINSFPVIPSTNTKVETIIIPGEEIVKIDSFEINNKIYITKTVTKTITIQRDSIITIDREQTGYITVTKDQDKKIAVLTNEKESLTKTCRRLVIACIVMGIMIIVYSCFKFIK